MNIIEHFNLPEHTNRLYREEAISSISLTRNVADKINELVDAYNELSKVNLDKIHEQDGTIRKAIIYLKDNLINTLHDLVELLEHDGFFDKTVAKYITELESRLDNLLGSVTEGSTSMDAEVIDARIRFSGEVFDNLGSTLRAIDGELQSLTEETMGLTIYHDDMKALSNWERPGSPHSEYVTITDTSCIIKQPGSNNIGVASKIFTVNHPSNKIYLYVDVECNQAEPFLYWWASEQIGYIEGKSKRCGKLKKGKNLIVIDPDDFNFNIKNIWLVQNGADSSLSYTYTINEFRVYQNLYNDIGLSGSALIDYITQLIELIATNTLKQDEVNRYITGQHDVFADTLNCLTVWEGNTIPDSHKNFDTNTITFNEWNNDGITTPHLKYDSSKLLHIEFDLKHSNDLGVYNIVMYGSDAIGTSGKFKVLKQITADGHHHITLDPAHYSVYEGLDIKYIWWIIKSCENATEITTRISNINIWQNGLTDSGFSYNMADNILKLSAQITGKESESGTEFLIAPNGSKYVTQINDSGVLKAIPVIPGKAFYLGNSLLCGFGYGMAASDSEHDYYHLINQAILQRKSTFTASKLQGNPWEGYTTISEKNAWMNNTLLPYLSEDTELVFVQLGDNVNTEERLAVFEEGAINLLKFIRSNCPNARVVWIGAWYQTQEKMEIMAKVCKETGCTFINIWDLNTADNQSSIGNTYTKEDGTTATVTDSGVASHPGDVGFKAIANRVLYQLGITCEVNFYG